MTRNKRVGAVAAVALTAAALFLIFLFRPARLVLCSADTGRVYRTWDAYDGMTFSVEFVHSVNKSPVRDIFEVRDRKIWAVATRYSAFGAGVQTEIEEGQTLSYDEDGAMVVSGFDLSFPKLSYIVGTVSDHILSIEGEEISLRELCGKNAAVVFEVR